ncbi:sec-independent translocase TatB-like protein isoform X1 [Senna tora]|uniref:Sec-independent translocase TatB-like protein isoform X1 n=1 Tax=Senna tora TaxID=362788 RepID=A0A834SPH1_9FABA|nr:sec-independent translocase TatB-like protein isoform X1 [Senna tora]
MLMLFFASSCWMPVVLCNFFPLLVDNIFISMVLAALFCASCVNRAGESNHRRIANWTEAEVSRTVTNAGIFVWTTASVAGSYCCYYWYSIFLSYINLFYLRVQIFYQLKRCVTGPKDLPIIARTAGRLAGRAIGYVQLARGQFDSVMQQSQARQVHKELQDTMAQLEAIRHEIRSVSFINPGPMTRRLVDNIAPTYISDDNQKLENISGENKSVATVPKDSASPMIDSCNMHRQATTYARLAESSIKNGLSTSCTEVEKIDSEQQLTIIPISAEDAGLLPNRGDPSSWILFAYSFCIMLLLCVKASNICLLLAYMVVEVEKELLALEHHLYLTTCGSFSIQLQVMNTADVKGSDIVLEAILEAEVARNAKEFFSQPQNQA